MRLGYKSGYRVPRCLSCLKYMHDPVESRHDLEWVFPHCGHYWVVRYEQDKTIHTITDSVTAQTCYRCYGTGYYGYRDINGEYEIAPCKITIPALAKANLIPIEEGKTDATNS